MRDVFNDALNDPSGQLAQVLLNKITPGGSDELPDHVRTRLDRIVDAPGTSGLLARVRLAAEVSFLFERAPKWTASRIVPLFDWASPEAVYVWSARKYSSYIGSPELFGLLKEPFLQLFGRSETSTEDRSTFAEWLAAIVIANQADGAGYPLVATEARSALRRAGVGALSSVAHRLALEMGKILPDQKYVHWRNVVGPAFQAIWPLDVELQTADTTFRLVQILLATGAAFPEACDAIIVFIQPEDPGAQTTVFSIAEADESIYKAAPSKVLELIAAVVGDARPGSVYALSKALARLRAIDQQLAGTRRFQKLLTYAS